jgi:hypothetical protein
MYTWYDSNPATNGGYSGTPADGADTEYFIKALNEAQFGGYTDWRLPTIKELFYIVDFSVPSPGPTINSWYFPKTRTDGLYWSSTTNAYRTDSAWGVDFYGGYCTCTNGNKDNQYYARAVRGGQSGSFDSAGDGLPAESSTAAGHYSDNGDGTISDSSTGLMWQQGTAGRMMSSWEQALAYCENLNLGGHTDWRLPTIKEIHSLVDYSRYNPAVNTTYFLDTQPSSLYWSSTTYMNDTSLGLAWSTYFRYGGNNGNFKAGDGSIPADVRAVRTGVSPDIKANGIDGETTVTCDSTVSVAISLRSGDKKGKSADWWFAVNSPWGWYFLIPSGLTQTPVPLYQSIPLLDVSNQKMIEGQLPVGDYEFFFGVYITPNDSTNSPLYADSVKVHVK